jgi:hypothetical protein
MPPTENNQRPYGEDEDIERATSPESQDWTPQKREVEDSKATHERSN